MVAVDRLVVHHPGNFGGWPHIVNNNIDDGGLIVVVGDLVVGPGRDRLPLAVGRRLNDSQIDEGLVVPISGL